MKNGEATALDVNKVQLLLINLKTELGINEGEIKRTKSKLVELISVKQRQYNALVNIYKALGGGWK